MERMDEELGELEEAPENEVLIFCFIFVLFLFCFICFSHSFVSFSSFRLFFFSLSVCRF